MIDEADLDWDDVRVFLETARRGSLAAAAVALGLSQTTVGRRLRRLEALVGAPLFERLANSLSPTPLGSELAAAAEAMRAGATALARRADAHLPGPVRVSATMSVALFLTGRLAEVAAAAGAAGLSVEPTRATSNLAQRQADIALRMRRVPADGELVTRRLGRIAFAPYVARALWGGRAAADDWRGVAVIGLPQTQRAPSQSRWLDEAAAARGATVPVRLGEVGLRQRAAVDGAGIALLPCFLGDAEPALLRLGAPPAALAEDVHLLVHADMRRAPAVRAVADAIAACFSRHAAALAGRADPSPQDDAAFSPSPAACGG